MTVTDFGAANGTYDLIQAATVVGTFTTAQLPSEDWNWGIEGGRV